METNEELIEEYYREVNNIIFTETELRKKLREILYQFGGNLLNYCRKYDGWYFTQQCREDKDMIKHSEMLTKIYIDGLINNKKDQ